MISILFDGLILVKKFTSVIAGCVKNIILRINKQQKAGNAKKKFKKIKKNIFFDKPNSFKQNQKKYIEKNMKLGLTQQHNANINILNVA